MCRGVFKSSFQATYRHPLTYPWYSYLKNKVMERDAVPLEHTGMLLLAVIPKTRLGCNHLPLINALLTCNANTPSRGVYSAAVGRTHEVRPYGLPKDQRTCNNKPLPCVSKQAVFLAADGKPLGRAIRLYYMDEFTLMILTVLGSPGLQANVGRRGKLVTTWNTPSYLKIEYHVQIAMPWGW